MRANITQQGQRGSDNRVYIPGDWYHGGIPGNVDLAENVYLDTSYGFATFFSKAENALRIGEGSGCYDNVSFTTSERGMISIGRFTILNATTFICNEQITVGDHCMLSWGSVIADSWIDPVHAARACGKYQGRTYPFGGRTSPVVIEDNVWIGFNAVILPGVRLGQGCIVGARATITADVPPYAVIAGSPAVIIRFLEPDDTPQAREEALAGFMKK